MEQRRPRRVEDYTTASLVLIFVNLIWILGVIWVKYGLLPVVLTGWALNLLITRIEQYRASREIRWPSDA